MDHLPGQELSGQGTKSLRTGAGALPRTTGNQQWFYMSLSSAFLIGHPLLSKRIKHSALHLKDLTQVWVVIVKEIYTLFLETTFPPPPQPSSRPAIRSFSSPTLLAVHSKSRLSGLRKL